MPVNAFDNHFEARLERLQTAVGAKSDTQLAKALDITHQGVSAVRKRRQLPTHWVARISECFDVSADWILYGIGPMRLSGRKEAPFAPKSVPARHEKPAPGLGMFDSGSGYAAGPVFQAGEVLLVRKVLPRLEPGTAVFERDGRECGVAFQHLWLASRGEIAKMLVMDMQGEHMSPTICRGDTILFDRSQTAIVPGTIYVLAFGSEVTVKRLDRLPGKLRLINDSPAHPATDIDFPHEEVQVLGRVLWCGKCLC